MINEQEKLSELYDYITDQVNTKYPDISDFDRIIHRSYLKLPVYVRIVRCVCIRTVGCGQKFFSTHCTSAFCIYLMPICRVRSTAHLTRSRICTAQWTIVIIAGFLFYRASTTFALSPMLPFVICMSPYGCFR